MSMWGKRVDGIFTPRQSATKTDYNRAGLNAIWQIVLVIVIAAIGLWLMQQGNANL